MGTLSGKGALVTGGSRGIGRAVVERLTAEGAEVVFCYERSEEAAEQVAKATGAHAVRADLGGEEDLARLFAEAESLLPGLDVLVNNAASAEGHKPLAEITDEEYDRVFAVNTRSVHRAMRWAARVMRDGGRIITLSSLNTQVPAPGLTLYCGSKGAVEQFTKVAARELGGRGITVNVVSSGATDTDMLRGANPPEALEQTAGLTALRRLGQPDDIASVVAFLAGPDSRWITGQNILASGGLLV
ncbi:SDR family oxidoreductase [Nonomuraea phyllanthi]|uniref:SDR family oxidoreductase n=1 Tax=Nonomuraea phyllanthi TaxID=2219224 RepID=UPI001293535F|nr:SDR family oxidoreductase [Nonomuraea phyllanthi]QFY11810.1 SDR family oxidoreductase [Nonomuraea phyllanthi]